MPPCLPPFLPSFRLSHSLLFTDLSPLFDNFFSFRFGAGTAQVILQCPERRTIKEWFWFYLEKFLSPRLIHIAVPLVVAYGAALCMDFSACDSRQLRPGNKTNMNHMRCH